MARTGRRGLVSQAVGGSAQEPWLAREGEMIPRITPKPETRQLECSACGAETEAACDCGVAYVPAGEPAAKAGAHSPNKSNPAISEEPGLADRTLPQAPPPTSQPP